MMLGELTRSAREPRRDPIWHSAPTATVGAASVWSVDGALDPGALQVACASVLDAGSTDTVQVWDFSTRSWTETMAAIRAESRRPLDLAHGDAARATVLKLAAQRAKLLLVGNAHVDDTWLNGVVMPAIAAAYRLLREGGDATAGARIRPVAGSETAGERTARRADAPLSGRCPPRPASALVVRRRTRPPDATAHESFRLAEVDAPPPVRGIGDPEMDVFVRVCSAIARLMCEHGFAGGLCLAAGDRAGTRHGCGVVSDGDAVAALTAKVAAAASTGSPGRTTPEGSQRRVVTLHSVEHPFDVSVRLHAPAAPLDGDGISFTFDHVDLDCGAHDLSWTFWPDHAGFRGCLTYDRDALTTQDARALVVACQRLFAELGGPMPHEKPLVDSGSAGVRGLSHIAS